MTDTETVPRRGREGSRWYNERPLGEELAEWFSTVKLHEGMLHENYVSGITLIQTIDKVKSVVAYNGDNQPLIADVEEITYTPYPRVDARIAYFWDYMDLHPELLGSIEAVGGDPDLPPGFFRLNVEDNGGKTVALIGRTMIVRIQPLRRGVVEEVYPSEVKTVPLVNRVGFVDPDAFARASTGAIGRALGVAGMLVLPGTGVATAEDMRGVQEDRTPASPVDAVRAALGASTEPAQSDEQVRVVLAEKLGILDKTDKREDLRDWWSQRRFPDVARLGGDELRVALVKVDQLLQNATPVEHSMEVVDAASDTN